jgi:L-threonylcarbamoyladenylate synthase
MRTAPPFHAISHRRSATPIGDSSRWRSKYAFSVPGDVVAIAESTDAQLVTRLTVEAWKRSVDPRSSGHRLTVERVRELMAGGAVALIASSSSGEPVGSVMMAMDGYQAELMKLAVPTASTQGVGSLLVEGGCDWARQHGASEVVLAVSVFQPQLCRYYARRGFVIDPEGTYPHASPLSPPPVVMRRGLAASGGASVGASADAEARPDPVGDAAAALQSGGLVIVPTETVYGLAALASDPVAVRRVFATKGRPVDHPLIVHITERHCMTDWAIDIPTSAYHLAEQLWPGPLTLVLRKAPHVLREVTGGLETVALRVPSHPVTLGLLGLLPPSSGIAAPSANRFGRVSPTTAADASADLSPYLAAGDLVLDGGPCRVGIESTIVDLTTKTPTVLRPGGTSIEQIEAVLGSTVERVASGPSRAPGMLAAHYAPMAGVVVVDVQDVSATVQRLIGEGKRVGLLGPHGMDVPVATVLLESPGVYDGDSLAPVLYARLRDADRLGVDALVVVSPPSSSGLGWAVSDRLRRAEHGSSRQS